MTQKNVCRPGDPNCAESPIVHDVVSERTAVAIKNILSGDNACGSLFGPDGKVNVEHLDRSIRPALAVYEDEQNMLLRDIAALRADNEAKRRALESVVANVVPPHPATLALLREALPNHPHLN